MMDEVDLRTLTLTQELAELDELPLDDRESRRPLIESALENAAELEKLGGGSLGTARVQEIRAALAAELGQLKLFG